MLLRRPLGGVAALVLSVTACAGDPAMPAASVVTFEDVEGASTPGGTESVGTQTGDTESDGAPDTIARDVDVLIRDDADGEPIDRRVFGVNVPAWLGALRLAEPTFREATVDSGATLIRMPGGSWSNEYDWLACERSDPDGCVFTGSARPSDYVGFLEGTGLTGMWTLSLNETAQSAAAAVAYFNGSIDDDREIGIDRAGEDWGTVGQWAALRAENGNAEPVGIQLWEVGNEVYGGRPDAGGGQCADFGWENVWTCDGVEYVVGTDEHDGYLAIREAMLAVDPTIEVGAVGVADPASWSDFGNEVIESAGDDLDFYVVHEYAFDRSPDPDDAVDIAGQMWAPVVDGLDDVLAGAPVAVTEYNLVSFEAGDVDQTMTKAMNALFLADTLGQLVEAGVPIAAFWNLANGTTSSGTDYGLVDVGDGGVFPAYHGFAVWGRSGTELLHRESRLPDEVHVYATRHDDGSIAMVLVNTADEPVEFSVGVASGVAMSGTSTAWTAESLDADELVESEPSDVELGAAGTATIALPAWSFAVWEVEVDG